MAYNQKKSMIAGTDPVKKAKKDKKFLDEQHEEAVKSTDYLTKTPNPTTKAIKSKSTLDNSSDHDMGNLKDLMRDEGVFSIGGQKND
tara:strand:- start:85 stop:345 length:261 start_codon:yes stop_codon:yes gene_type:complete